MATRADHAREAFVCACIALACNWGRTRELRIVVEDSLAALQGVALEPLEDRMRDIARAWLTAGTPADLADHERTIRMMTQEKFVQRMVNAHDQFRTT